MKVSSSTLALLLLTAKGTDALSSVSPSAPSVSNKIAGARRLGGTDLVVSEACLGTMTWGLQNTPEEAYEQMDYAIHDCGVNFLDAAELYPVPFFAPEWKAGGTETIIGNYLHKIGSAQRDELVVATKVCGFMPNSPIAAARYDPPKEPFPDARLDMVSVKTACDASLKRLQTDRIDLYQVHWPDRYLPMFGHTFYDHPQKRDDSVAIEETAAAMRDLIEEGKVRYIGLSNESPLGVAQWVAACEKLGIRDKLASIQNSYSLIDRRFDGDLAEMCDHEPYQLGLLPWSILAGGLLTGKYSSSASSNSKTTKASPNARFEKYPDFMSRWSPPTATPATLSAVDEYAAIAQAAGMTPAQLAVAFCRSRPFIAEKGSTIVGATTMEQLKENLEQFNQPLELDEEVLKAINDVHEKHPDPCCSLGV